MLFAFGLILTGGNALSQPVSPSVLVQSTLDAGGGRSYGNALVVDSSLDAFLEVRQTTASGLRLDSGYIAALNEPPARMRSILGPPNNGSGTVRIADLIGSGADPEGDLVTISLTGTNTVRGGVVRQIGDTFVYIAPIQPPLDGNDWFTFIMTDPFGGQEIGTVMLTTSHYSGTTTEIRRVPAGMAMTFQGTGSILYKLQFRSSVSASGLWQDFPDSFSPLVGRADGTGTHGFTVDTSLRQGFFRTVALEIPSLQPSISRSGNQIAMTFSGAPGIVYKLQSRASFDATAEWKDFPDKQQVATQQAEWDGRVFFNTPTGSVNEFFRVAPFLPR